MRRGERPRWPRAEQSFPVPFFCVHFWPQKQRKCRVFSRHSHTHSFPAPRHALPWQGKEQGCHLEEVSEVRKALPSRVTTSGERRMAVRNWRAAISQVSLKLKNLGSKWPRRRRRPTEGSTREEHYSGGGRHLAPPRHGHHSVAHLTVTEKDPASI